MAPPTQQSQPPSRKNHYVPVWYQAGFQLGGGDNWLLDISRSRLRPDGTPIILVPRMRPPKSCFWENDLYVTRFGEMINDQVETVLFQDIDNFGADAVRAFVDGDEQAKRYQLEALFSYLGAQKLRTPRGLAWIKSRYPALSQVELMVELQHLRHMYGTLWAESVREIVSAESSDVKFLISDHPVTMFNAALPEDAPHLADPLDPPLTWNGTQTLFALNANHLLILTHVPYAEAPNRVNATAKRINARYFGQTLIRTDALIRSRRLTADHVNAVNGWLKTRARRYIAAASKEWLYPERDQQLSRDDLAQLLLPPRDGLWRYGGETYIGYADGTYGYHDQYGRTTTEYEVVAKQAPVQPPSIGDPCPCGSGDTYLTCCESRLPWERPPWDVLSLRERNLQFVNAIFNVLELDSGTPWTQVQRELSDDQVSRLHRLGQWLWPTDTDLAALLPKRDRSTVSAVYMGPSDPRTLGESIASLSPLFDQILVMDPFLLARNVRPEYSPVVTPAQHKQQLLKNVLFWIALVPLIEAGKVLVFPDPGDVKPEMGHAVRTMARKRTAEWKMDPTEYREMSWLTLEDTERAIMRMPDKYVLARVKESSPGISDMDARDVLAYMRSQQEQDPFALLQVASEGESGQFLVMRSVNLEIALFIAQLTGAVIVTDVSAMWRQLHLHTRAGKVPEEPSQAGATLRFTPCLHPDLAVAIDALPEAAAVRAAIRKLKTNTDRRCTSEDVQGALEEVRVHLNALSESIESMDEGHPNAQVSLALSVPDAGFESPDAQRLVVSFGSDDAPVNLGLAFFRSTEGGGAAAPRSETVEQPPPRQAGD